MLTILLLLIVGYILFIANKWYTISLEKIKRIDAEEEEKRLKDKEKDKKLFLAFMFGLLLVTGCCKPHSPAATYYCNSVHINNDVIELSTTYRNRISVIEVVSVDKGIVVLNDNVGGMWKLRTYLVDGIYITYCDYKLIIDGDDDYSTISVINNTNKYVRDLKEN